MHSFSELRRYRSSEDILRECGATWRKTKRLFQFWSAQIHGFEEKQETDREQTNSATKRSRRTDTADVASRPSPNQNKNEGSFHANLAEYR